MGIILDADVIIRGEKELFDLNSWLAKHTDEEFQVAAITVAELWHGIERATPAFKQKRVNYLQTTLANLPVCPYTEQTAYEHARIWAELESAGKMTGYYDLIVAATAIERGSQVATFNRHHFDSIPRLTVIEPA